MEEWKSCPLQIPPKFQAFEDSLVVLKPQEFRRYELPYPEGWALVITVIAECSNGSDDEMYFAAGDHPPAVRSLAFGRASTKRKAIRAVKNKANARGRPTNELYFVLDLALLKDFPELFGNDDSEF